MVFANEAPQQMIREKLMTSMSKASSNVTLLLSSWLNATADGGLWQICTPPKDQPLSNPRRSLLSERNSAISIL